MQTSKILNATVIVTALGYLVDIYDILIFNITRVASLTDLGLSGTALTDAGLFILNMQLLGLILGGLFFGVLGDKIGRKQCLLGSILIYSFSTLLCALVQTSGQYAFLRFAAGFGLAGETGIGIALICECMTKEKRTLGITVFTSLGVSGAVIAAILSEFLPWRVLYVIGGATGLLLLVTRAFVMESGLFKEVKKNTAVVRGSLKMLLTNKSLLAKYLLCILVATPIWFTIGMIWTLAPELAKTLGATTPVRGSIAIGIGYAGLMTGDFICGLMSYRFKNRKKVIFFYMLATACLMAWLLTRDSISASEYYALSFALGLGIGYWVNFVSIAAEQFGTNIRATVATSIPNFARATLLPMNLAFASLKGTWGIVPSISFLAFIAFALAFLALWRLEETFHKDLDYVESGDAICGDTA